MNKPFVCLLVLILFASFEGFGQVTFTPDVQHRVIKNGIGLGSVLAVVTSWERNKSVLWMLIHAIFSWFYVIYFVATRLDGERK